MSKKAEFEKLKKKWYSKLKESGFEDIEQDEDRLKVWSSDFRLDKSTKLAESKEAYYYMAGNFLNDYKFENQVDKIIWEKHAEAMSVRDIAVLLKETGVKKISYFTVWQVVNRLEVIMKKMYITNKSQDE